MFKRLIKKLWPKFLIMVGQATIRLLLWTCRVKIHGLEHFIKASEGRACVLMLWHDRLALVGPIAWQYARHRRYAAFVSASRDGKWIHTICKSYPHCRVIRVHRHGRHLALREMIQQLRTMPEVLLITPDGPRGPRHQVKPGLGLAARMAQVPVIPFTWSASRFWQLQSWDKLLLPKPFSRIVVYFGAPVELGENDDETRLENELRLATKQACQEVVKDESRWPE